MNRITSRRDLGTWLYDARSDLTDLLSQAQLEQALDFLVEDAPDWGADWEEQLRTVGYDELDAELFEDEEAD